MAKFRVAVIGTGIPWKSEGATGFGMSRSHAAGFVKSGKCEIIALSDLIEDRMARFNGEFCEGKAAQFTDYEKMLAEIQPEIVSIATWPHLHAPMTIAAAKTPGVKAIHCEKPMATTYADAKQMAEACAANNIQLTLNHQRRHLPTFLTARRLVSEGVIGTLTRMEASCGNMLDWGTHWLNKFQMMNAEVMPSWVMGQVDVRKLVSVFGVKHDTDGIAVIGYENGVFGTLYTGDNGEKLLGCSIRLIGTEGTLELHNTAPHLRLWTRSGYREITGPETGGGLHGDSENNPNADNVVDLVNCLESKTTPLCDVSNALPTTEIIYAIYESARRRGRIDLPLTIEDSPLDAMIDAGIFPNANA
jgi:UDP-N-acetylglucosamine 3-dehydrogenase